MSWSNNAPYSGEQEEDRLRDIPRREGSGRKISEMLGSSLSTPSLSLDVTEAQPSPILHPATLVRRKALPGARPHPKPFAASRQRAEQAILHVAEDAQQLLEDYIETKRPIQAKRLTMSLARALEADLGHWEWSLPERGDHLQGLHGQLEHLQSLCQPLLTCLIAGGAWAVDDLTLCCTAPLEYLANPVLLDAASRQKKPLPWLRHYPILLLAYGMGIAAVAGGRYETLTRLFHEVSVPDPCGTGHRSFVAGLFASSWMDREFLGDLPEVPAKGSLTDHLHSVLEEPLRELTGRPALYDHAFDRFDLFLACAYAQETLNSGKPLAWVPQERTIGSALNRGAASRLETEARKDGASWPPLRAGLSDGSLDRFLEVLHKVEVLRGNRLNDQDDDAI